MADRAVELRRGAGQPQIGEVVTWDGEGWVAQAPMSRRGVIGPTGITEWLRLSTGMEGPDIDIDAAALKIGRGGDSILLFHANGSPVSEYAATLAGLIEAEADATNRDVIVIPQMATYVSGDFTISTNDLTIVGPPYRQSQARIDHISGTVTVAGDNVKLIGLGLVKGGSNAKTLLIEGSDALLVGCHLCFHNKYGWAVRVTGGSAEFQHCVLQQMEAGSERALIYATGGVTTFVDCDLLSDTILGAWAATVHTGGGTVRLLWTRVTNDGAGVQLKNASGTIEVCGCDLDNSRTEGTITYREGDRGAYSVEDYHASDIEAGEMTRHLPAPGTAGHVARDDGSKWVSAVLDFDDLGGDCDLADLAGYARGSIIRGGAADWEAYDAKTDGAALVGDGTDIFSTVTPTWLGTHTWGSGLAIMPTDASGQALGDATHRWDLYTQEVVFGGATGANSITVPDDLADALHLSDAGGLEYMRIVSTDAQPVVVFNNGEADVDFRVAASGITNALFVQGSDGAITVAGPSLAAPDDWWIGLGAAAGRIVFDSTPAPDEVNLVACESHWDGQRDIYPDDAGRGFWARAINRIGIDVYDWHFRTGDPAPPTGYAWQGAPFVAPGAVNYARGSDYLGAVSTAGNRSFMSTAVANNAAAWDGLISARIRTGITTQIGLRFDDGTDNNYAEIRMSGAAADATQRLTFVWRAGGGAVNTVNSNLIIPVDTYIVVILRMHTGGGRYVAYGYVASEDNEWVNIGGFSHDFGAAGPFPAAGRVGIIVENAGNYGMVDWLYENFG